MEIRDITIAILVLSLSFTIILLRGSHLNDNQILNFIELFLISLILVILSFMTHELGHKFVAQKHGAWSEFRMFPVGLLLCIVMSLIGFLFAAPGAVYINGYLDEKTSGKVSAAGPLMNIIVGAIGLILMVVSAGSSLWYSIFYQLTVLNAFLAIFNLLPFGPLDGAKIIKWDAAKWGLLLVASIAIYAIARYVL